MSDFQTEYQRLLSYSNLQEFVYPQPLKLAEASLTRVKDFLSRLSSPQNTYKIIHVTGTSGKGSTVQLMRHVLTQCGFKSGAYVSPHITSYADRFLLDGGLHKEASLTQALKRVNDNHDEWAKQNIPLSFFELSTCVAFVVNAIAKVDYLVLEVGLGGRLDATNIIDTPELAVITNIDMDHTEFLGNSLAEIAYEKSGIMKKDGTVIIGEVRPSLKPVFTKEAIKNDATLFFVAPPTAVGAGGLSKGQLHNHAIVQNAAEKLGLPKEKVREALENPPMLAARFERMPGEAAIYIDGAHSPAKITSTIEQMSQLDGQVHVLFGASKNKNTVEMIELLAPACERLVFTRFEGAHRKAANPAHLFESLREVSAQKPSEIYFNPHQALQEELAIAKKAGVSLIVTGSFFLAGELRAKWYPENAIRTQATLTPVS